MLSRMNDEDLMTQFQTGAVEAFTLLVKRYQDRLQRYVLRFVRDGPACEDLVQETFLRVHRNRHAYRRISKFSTWLYTIAGNLARSEYRKRKRRRVYSLQAVNRDDESYEIQVPDDAVSPERRTEGVVQRRHFDDALKRVPDAFQEVVVLRDVQELTYQEIVEITGLPMGTVKSRINRGRARLRVLLEDVYRPTQAGPWPHGAEAG